MKNTLIHLSSSPYSNLSCKEGLDLALVLATFEQEVDICLSGAALSLINSTQAPTVEQGKNLHKLLAGLEFYDIENLYVHASNLEAAKQANDNNLWQGTKSLNDTEWHALFSNYQQVFRF